MVKEHSLLYMGLFFTCLYPLETHADAIPGITRYEGLETLVKASGLQIQVEQAQYDSRLARHEDARKEIMGTRRPLGERAEDLKKNRDKDSVGQYRAQAKTPEDAAKDMDKQIRSTQGNQASMSLRKMKDTVLWIAQNPMSTYNTLKVEREATLAQIEWKQNQYGKLLRRVQTGSTSTTQADQVGKKADAAAARAKAVQDEMEWVKRGLFVLIGIPEDSQAGVNPMPAPRPERALEMGGNTDKWRVLGNNYPPREQRSGGASFNEELHARQQDIRQSEEVMYGQLDTLYRDALVGQTLWTSAVTSVASQEAAFQTASNKLALGMLSCQEYLEARAAYMDAATTKERADISLQQIMDTYNWALRGFMT